MKAPVKVIVARFYRLPGGREPVRDWLLKLRPGDRRIVGQDIMAVEFGWPCRAPLCKSLANCAGLFEVRSRLRGGQSARVFFCVSSKDMILLHGFVKKSRATPQNDLKLANRRMKEHQEND